SEPRVPVHRKVTRVRRTATAIVHNRERGLSGRAISATSFPSGTLFVRFAPRRRFHWRLSLLSEDRFTRQLDPVLIVNRNDLDLQSIADLADFIHRFHVTGGKFADMAKAVLAGCDFDERAEILDRTDRSIVDPADKDGLC